jgi:hypothetical protein
MDVCYRLRTLAYELNLDEGGPGGPFEVPPRAVIQKMMSAPATVPFTDLTWFMLAGTLDNPGRSCTSTPVLAVCSCQATCQHELACS